MPVHDELGTRMKTFYEAIPKTKLMRRTPVAIRIDGKAFHTFTKGFKKPFDEILIKTMQKTMKYLCENIQGCILGYTQSDEITLILKDYQTLETCAWFDYEVQKVCSITASMATMAFNKYFSKNVNHEIMEYKSSFVPQCVETQQEHVRYHNILLRAVGKGAMFDARCFNIPKEEVANLLYWRQLDAMRNSVQMIGQAYFSHKELQNKSCNMIKEMLQEQKGIDWDNMTTVHRMGSCCIKKDVENILYTSYNGKVEKVEIRNRWIVDKAIPIFKDEGREYIERLI